MAKRSSICGQYQCILGDIKDHLEDLHNVFQSLLDARLKLKPQKSLIGMNKLVYLGHIFSKERHYS